MVSFNSKTEIQGFLHSSELAKCPHLVVIMYAFCVVQLHPDKLDPEDNCHL